MVEHDPARPRIEPFRLLLAGVCVLYAAVALIAFDHVGSPAIRALENRWLASVYLAGLLVAGAVSVTGTVRRWPRLEGIGMFALSGIWLCFAILGYAASGSRATAFSSFLTAFAVAALCVWWQNLGGGWWQARRARHAARRGA